jgi:hypothetical protein
MNKTPEEMAEEYANDLAEDFDRLFPEDAAQPFIETFLAGYRSRDEEVEQLKEEIATLKADLREGFRDE